VADWLISGILREFEIRRAKDLLASVKELSNQTRFRESPMHGAYEEFLQLIIQSLGRVRKTRDFLNFGQVVANALSIANSLTVLQSLELSKSANISVDHSSLSDISVANPSESSLAFLLFLLSFKRAFHNVQIIAIQKDGNRLKATFRDSSDMYMSSLAKKLFENGFNLHRDSHMVVQSKSVASLGDILGAALKGDDESNPSKQREYSVFLTFLTT